MFGFHVYLITNNITTIEFKFCNDISKFSRGSSMENARAILGKRVWTWFVPIKIENGF